jgi:hypothetical protein
MISPQRVQTSLPMAPGREGADSSERCERQFVNAKREMGSFVTAVRKLYGSAEADRAAEYWIELAESTRTPLIDGYPNWRHITIAAAGQLAKDHFPTGLSARTRHGASRPS